MTATLTDVIRAANKQYGQHTIGTMDEFEHTFKRERIPTGISTVDYALGGGFSRGLIHEISGIESSGKSTLVYQTLGHAQRQGLTCALFDVEQTANRDWLQTIGVDTARLIYSAEYAAEQVWTMVQQFVQSRDVHVIAVDSIAAMVPPAEDDAEYGKEVVGRLAKITGQAVKKLTPLLNEHQITLLLVNQLRSKFNTRPGEKETYTPGGRGLHHACATRTYISRIGWLKDGITIAGLESKALVEKNKTSPPRREAEYSVRFDRGVLTAHALISLAVALKVMTQTGAYYEFAGQKWQGKDKAAIAIDSQPELLSQLETKVKEATGLGS